MRVSKLRKLGRPITPDDLRNPNNASGYDYVGNGAATTIGASPGTSQKWRASQGPKNGDPSLDWHGPCRRNPRDAAQDFCDRFNGGVVQPATLATPGHEYTVDERDNDPEYLAALGVIRDRTAQRKGKQGYVYLIIEDNPGGGITYGKLGYSTNPEKRVAELQTGNPRPLRLLYKMPGTEADERRLHRKYIEHNVLQEWFRPTKELLLEFPVSGRVYTDAEKRMLASVGKEAA